MATDLPPGVSEEDFELYGDEAPQEQDSLDDYGEDHGIPESQQNGHGNPDVKEEPMEDDSVEDTAPTENGDEGAAAASAEEDGEEQEDESEEEDSSDDEFVVNVGEIKRPEPKVQVQGKVDLDGTPLINGQPIYDLDLAAMEDRPWRKPGADINDYFNYGFNEESWNTYCERQKKLRHEFANNQIAANKSLFNSINLLNPVLTTTSTGRQLVNICGAENPHNNHKVVVDLTKPPPSSAMAPIKTETIIRTDLTNLAPKNLAPVDSKPISVLDFSKPPPMMSNLVVTQPQDGPPGVDDSSAPGTEPTTPSVTQQPSAIPPMDMSMPPPGFNPNMPPPPLRMGGPPPTHMPPPGFGGMPTNHAMAGFSNPMPRFSRPPPLRDFHPPGYGPPPGMDGFDREQNFGRERSYSGESDDEEHRRSRKHRRRSHSRSPSSKRRREEKDRDRERDYGRERDGGDRDRERDRERERERDRERRRRHEDYERESRSSRSSRREREDRDKDREKRHRDSDSERESSRKERRRREASGEKESRRDRGKE